MSKETRYLERQEDGSWIDWGRHGPNRSGATVCYMGEDAKVLDLLLGYKENKI